MTLYPNEPYLAPEIGDIFVVEEVDKNVIDYHWGKCVYVKLRHVEETKKCAGFGFFYEAERGD